jgi:hypothetical protein
MHQFRIASAFRDEYGIASGRGRRIGDKQLVLRGQLWPEVTDEELWMRKRRDDCTTIPRGMPLILGIMNDLSKNQPVASTYFELWCRAFDGCFVTLSKWPEMALHAGFTGKRAVHIWMQRMARLAELGFISIKPGPSGHMSYALIYNPYKVTQRLYAAKTPGLCSDKYNGLLQRMIEIGVPDLTEVSPLRSIAATDASRPAAAPDRRAGGRR